jgi:hypothetical protein
MPIRTVWYVFAAIVVVVLIFELFFRYRYVHAGNQLWRIDRVTERACLVQIGEAICSPPPAPRVAPRARYNPYLYEPTPEPNPR